MLTSSEIPTNRSMPLVEDKVLTSSAGETSAATLILKNLISKELEFLFRGLLLELLKSVKDAFV